MNKKYYKVMVERGHIGAGDSLESAFYFEANNAYHAMCLARKMPSVKHNKLPLKVEEITMEEYLEGRKISAYHQEGQEYFKSKHGKNKKYNKSKKPLLWY